MTRVITNATQNYPKGRIKIDLSYLYAWEIQPGIPQVLHPSAEELNNTRRDRVKRVSS
jgi:hypothetical protein